MKKKNCNIPEQIDIQPTHFLPEDAYPFGADSTGEGDPDVIEGYIQIEESKFQPELSIEKEQLAKRDSNPDSQDTTYLKNKNVVILDATSAIGLAITENLSRLGCRLFICSHDSIKLEAAFRKIRISYPENGICGISFDSIKKETIERALATACHQLGCIDIVINNIAVEDSLQDKNNWQEDDFLPRYFNGVLSALPIMAKQSTGFILNILPVLLEDTGRKCLTSAITAFSSVLNEEVNSLGITIEVLPSDNQTLANVSEIERERELSRSVARRAVDSLQR